MTELELEIVYEICRDIHERTNNSAIKKPDYVLVEAVSLRSYGAKRIIYFENSSEMDKIDKIYEILKKNILLLGVDVTDIKDWEISGMHKEDWETHKIIYNMCEEICKTFNNHLPSKDLKECHVRLAFIFENSECVICDGITDEQRKIKESWLMLFKVYMNRLGIEIDKSVCIHININDSDNELIVIDSNLYNK